MPLIVENQLETFRSDPILSKLAEGVDIQYAGIPHSPSTEERRQKLLQDCDNMCLPITVLCNGVNLNLLLTSMDLQETEVTFESDLVFNGVCVRYKGRLNRNTLKGHGRIEYDAQRADQEKKRIEQRTKSFGQRIIALRNLILQYGRPHPAS